MKTHRINPSSLLRSLLFERPGYRLLILALSLIAATLGVCAPYAQKHFVDDLLAGMGDPARKWVWLAFGLTIGAQALVQASTWLAMRESLISQKAMADTAFARILEGPGGLIGRRPAGEAVSLFAVDVPGAAALLAEALAMISSMLFPLILAPIALHAFFGIPWLTSGAALAALLTVNFVLAYRQSKFFYWFKQLAAERTGLVAEWVQNIRTLRILGWVEAAERKIFVVRRRETANRKAMVVNGQVMNSVATTATFFLNIFAVLVLFRIRQAQSGQAPSPGELLSLLWILGVFLARPVRQLPWVFVISMDALSSMRRLQAALNLPIVQPRVLNPDGAAEEKWVLEVRGLNLAGSQDRKLLTDITLCMKPGEFVAVVGEVGSGKSLLLQSLVGATGASFERFAVLGKSTAGPSDPAVRGRFAFVPQEGFTMSATLRENVVFDYLEASHTRSEESALALRSLSVSQFIPERERVVDGLDTEIGERGVNLSGGQRQRIGLARAHFAGRELVLMDDCLSAVDVDTEKRLIDELICGEWSERARLLVTHRMSVLPRCDRVIFMEDGSVSMQGTYAQLLEGSPRFREFVRREAVKGVEADAE